MSAAGGRITAGVGANLIGQHAQDRNQEATVYVGNLDAQVLCCVSAWAHGHRRHRVMTDSKFNLPIGVVS